MVEPPLKKIKLKVKRLVAKSLSNVVNDEAGAENEVVVPVPEPVTKVNEKLKGWKGWVIVGEGEKVFRF